MTTFKVMTWNLENLFLPHTKYGPKTDEQYQQKLASLADMILFHRPDVLAVQEVGGLQPIQDLMALLNGEYPIVQLSANPDPRGIRVGFLARQAFKASDDFKAFPAAGLPEVPGLAKDGTFSKVTEMGRGALRVQVEPKPGFAVSLIAAHLKSKLLEYPAGNAPNPRFTPHDENERARVAGVALLKRTAEAVAVRAIVNDRMQQQPQEALIVLGDMNDGPLAATTQILHGPSGSEIGSRGFKRPDRGDASRLFNLAPLIPADRQFSRIQDGVKELIDHIFVSQALLPLQPDKSRRLPTVDSDVDNPLPSVSNDPNARIGAPGSDHAPIVATFDV